MSEIFITLEEAATLEDIKYNTLVQRIKRNPDGFRTKTQSREGGGKDQVMVAVSSLTPKAKSTQGRTKDRWRRCNHRAESKYDAVVCGR